MYAALGIPPTGTCPGRVHVVMDLRYGRLTSELISLSVGSELTFYAALDSFSARRHGKNCPVKIFEVYTCTERFHERGYTPSAMIRKHCINVLLLLIVT